MTAQSTESPLFATTAATVAYPPGSTIVDQVFKTLAREAGYAASLFEFTGIGNDNEQYFDKDARPESEVIKHLVALGTAVLLNRYRGLGLWYKPESITSGLLAHEVADGINQGRRAAGRDDLIPSTYDLGSRIGKDRLRHEVIDPNRFVNLMRSHHAQKLMPYVYLVVPLMLESAVRELVNNPALSGMQEYEEEAFMLEWRMVIRHCRGMLVDGDPRFSRNSIWEVVEGVLIQAGLMPPRPEADMDILDANLRPMTLLDHARDMAECLRYQLGKEFEPREAASALAMLRTIDVMLRANDPRLARANAALCDRPPVELAAMDDLYEEIDPLICAYAAGWLRDPDDLLPLYGAAYYAARKREMKTGDLHRPLSAGVRREMKKYADDVVKRKGAIIRGKLSDENRFLSNNILTPNQRRFDPGNAPFAPCWRAVMFEDKLFDRLQAWEQAVLPFIIGYAEAVQYPAEEPVATMIIADLKGGEAAAQAAAERGVTDINELHGVMGRSARMIERASRAWIEKTEHDLINDRPHRVFISTLDLLHDAKLIDMFRKACPNFIMARGSNATSALFRLVYAMKTLERNADEAVFQKGWEHRDYTVQLRVHARLIQAGLIDRPVTGGVALQVYTGGNKNVQDSMLVDVSVLTHKLEECAAAGARAPEQALALIRLLALDDLIVDTRLGEGAVRIDPHAGCVSWMDYDSDAFLKIRARAMDVLAARPELWAVDRERLVAEAGKDDAPQRQQAIKVQNRLMEKYMRAMEAGSGRQAVRKARPGIRGRAHVFDGPQQ